MWRILVCERCWPLSPLLHRASALVYGTQWEASRVWPPPVPLLEGLWRAAVWWKACKLASIVPTRVSSQWRMLECVANIRRAECAGTTLSAEQARLRGSWVWGWVHDATMFTGAGAPPSRVSPPSAEPEPLTVRLWVEPAAAAGGQ